MAKYFVVYAPDAPNMAETRAKTRPEHLARLASPPETIRIHSGGALLGEDGVTPVGSMMVMSASSIEEARAFMDADPYVREGIYAQVLVYPYRWSLGAPAGE